MLCKYKHITARYLIVCYVVNLSRLILFQESVAVNFLSYVKRIIRFQAQLLIKTFIKYRVLTHYQLLKRYSKNFIILYIFFDHFSHTNVLLKLYFLRVLIFSMIRCTLCCKTFFLCTSLLMWEYLGFNWLLPKFFWNALFFEEEGLERSINLVYATSSCWYFCISGY